MQVQSTDLSPAVSWTPLWEPQTGAGEALFEPPCCSFLRGPYSSNITRVCLSFMFHIALRSIIHLQYAFIYLKGKVFFFGIALTKSGSMPWFDSFAHRWTLFRSVVRQNFFRNFFVHTDNNGVRFSSCYISSRSSTCGYWEKRERVEVWGVRLQQEILPCSFITNIDER